MPAFWLRRCTRIGLGGTAIALIVGMAAIAICSGESDRLANAAYDPCVRVAFRLEVRNAGRGLVGGNAGEQGPRSLRIEQNGAGRGIELAAQQRGKREIFRQERGSDASASEVERARIKRNGNRSISAFRLLAASISPRWRSIRSR
jgi:hypothetical protein